jgi:hypothetical protein
MDELLYWAVLMDGRITIPTASHPPKEEKKSRMKLRWSQVHI